MNGNYYLVDICLGTIIVPALNTHTIVTEAQGKITMLNQVKTF